MILGSLSGVAHSSPSDVRLSSASVPGAVASVCSESSNSSSSLSSSLESSTRDPLPPCILKRIGGGIGDGGEGKLSTGAGGGGVVDGGEDRPEEGCEVMYISGLGNVTSGR